MLGRLGLDRMRPLVAVLLLLGVFLAGTVDAVACEPMVEEASHVASEAHDADGGGKDSSPGSEKHGLCSHGHCHHGGQLVQAVADESLALPVAEEYRPELAGTLHSSAYDGLKRPPRT